MKQSIILGTALAMALSVAPAFAGNFDALKTANGTSMSNAELASVEGKMRRSRGNSIRIRNNSYVVQKNKCRKCRRVFQGNNNHVRQNASLKRVNINVKLRFGGLR